MMLVMTLIQVVMNKPATAALHQKHGIQQSGTASD
jgi:hypothetical protein